MKRLRSPYTMDAHAATLGNMMVKWLETVEPSDIWVGCISCRHFEGDRICMLAKVQPPASVILKGCERYEDAVEIPF
jgi:hypothetical protein